MNDVIAAEGVERAPEKRPVGVAGPAQVAAARPNVAWWQLHGGDEWLCEVERRRPTEPRYARQEQWLVDHFRAQPALRVLDFGCGYGRHLRNLRALPHLDLYGCDMSPTMFAKIGEYVGDGAWARAQTRLIEPLGRIPFEDGFFDVTYVSEVLIHVAPEDLQTVLQELVRVTRDRLVLIENKRTDGTRFGTAAHDGCWLHDFRGLFRALGIEGIEILEEVFSDQDVYLVQLFPPAANATEQQLRAAITSRNEDLARSHRRLAELEGRCPVLEAELTEAVCARILADTDRVRAEHALAQTTEMLAGIEGSLSRRVLKQAKKVKGYEAVRRAALATASGLRRLGSVGAGEDVAAAAPALPFGGIAAAASHRTPEAFLAARPRVVSICHPEWRGIRAATYSLCDAVLEVPIVRDDDHARALGRFLADAGAEVVVIQGIPPGSQRLAISLRRHHPKLRLLHVFHGSSAQHTLRKDESVLLDDMLELSRRGVLDGIGFVKAGMAEALRRCGYPSHPLYNKVAPVERRPAAHAARGSGVHVGVFVPDLWVKNINTQVLAALSVEGSTVHVTEAPSAKYLQRFKHRVLVEGMLPHDSFVHRLGDMDVNLYVSLSECYPMTVLESLERGVPCLTSHTSPIFDDDRYLLERLVVSRHDDASAIARQLELALRDRAEIVARGHAHLQLLNAKADALWTEFTRG